MKINYKKTKVILFNPCTSLDFTPKIKLSDQSLQMVEETRLLGLIVCNDFKWSSNTDHIVKKAYKRLWILRRLNKPNTVDPYVTPSTHRAKFLLDI